MSSSRDKNGDMYCTSHLRPPVGPHTAKIKVAKLIDSYLAELARDSNLTFSKFQALAEALPEFSRITDDGLYRAIDTYLKVCSVLIYVTSMIPRVYFYIFILILHFQSFSFDQIKSPFQYFVQAHPGLSEHERKKLCRMMDCQRLSLEACMHAAQNERLPLRIVVQVRSLR